MLLFQLCACTAQVPTGKGSSTAPVAVAADHARGDADPTLYPDEYEALGIPSIQEPWTASAQAKAVVALTALAQKHPEKLPRLASKHSGSVFRRFVSRDNLLIYAKRDIDWNIRKTSLTFVSERLLMGSLIYVEAFQHGQPLEREVLELFVQVAHCANLTWKTMDEIAKDMYRPDEGYAGRLAGLNEMQAGTTRVTHGMFLMLGGIEATPFEDFAWYVAELVVLVPQLVGRLKTAQQVALQEELTQLTQEVRDPRWAKELKRLEFAALHPIEQLLPRPTLQSEATP